MDFVDKRVGIFGAFAAAGEQGRANKVDFFRVNGKIIFDLLRQTRQRLGERIFQDDERFAQASGGKRVAQNQVVRRENIFREENAQLPADLNGALDDRHDFNLNARRIFTRINLDCLLQSPAESRRLL